MRVSLLIPFLQLLLSVRPAHSERNLPADLQVDLIFPLQNETYAPPVLGGYFPIIFAVQNLDAISPLKKVDIWINLNTNPVSLWRTPGDLSLGEAFALNPAKYFAYTYALRLPEYRNNTGRYFISWALTISDRCFANGTEHLLSYERHSAYRSKRYSPDGLDRPMGVLFNLATGAQLPDIEATVNSCPAPSEWTTATVRFTDFKYDTCPMFEPNVTALDCGYKSVAKDISANVSKQLLAEMRCKEGIWQTGECSKGSASLQLTLTGGSGTVWGLLVIFFLVLNVL